MGILCLLLLWEGASRLMGSALLLPGPLPVLRRLIVLAGTRRFLQALGESFFRVIRALLISVPLGAAAGIAAGLDRRVRSFLSPLFAVIAATPVMAVILIIFLWLGPEETTVCTAFLMVFPVMAANTLEGVGRVDPKLVELFRVYGIGPGETLRRLYIPSVAPFILGGLRSSLSLCWKVVAAAEVLVQPLRALGTGMQQAKAQLETADLFAWTVATVITAALCQVLLSLAIRLFQRRGRS